MIPTTIRTTVSREYRRQQLADLRNILLCWRKPDGSEFSAGELATLLGRAEADLQRDIDIVWRAEEARRAGLKFRA